MVVLQSGPLMTFCTHIQHAKRKRVLADRYANTNVLRSGSLGGIQERSKRFVDRCSKSLGGSIDLFVSPPFPLLRTRLSSTMKLID